MVRGITGFELLIAGMMFTFVILIVGLLPAVYVKRKLDHETIFEYRCNKVQHLLLTLFSITYDERKVSESIAEHYLINKPDNLNFLKPYLDREMENKCYHIAVHNKTMFSTGSCDVKCRTNTTLVLPYNLNKLVTEIMVDVG